MCDRCGGIFSEREDGWRSMEAATIRRDPETGRSRSVVEMLDTCPPCTQAANVPPTPRILENVQKQALEGRSASVEPEAGPSA